MDGHLSLSVCPLVYLKKPQIQISPNFLYLLHAAVQPFSYDSNAIRYALSPLVNGMSTGDGFGHSYERNSSSA